MRRLIPILVLATTLPGRATAQQSTDGPYVLHEYVENLDLQSGTAAAAPDGAPRPSAAEMFAPGEPPALSLETRPGEPIYDKDGPLFDRPIDAPYGGLTPFAGANTLDERTDRVDSLTYFANFDPSVIPYKRVVAKNHAVRRAQNQYALEVQPGRRQVVAVEAMAAPDTDVFWGTFLLRMERGRLHPIASVSPDQRVLQVVSEPEIGLDVERDAADNFFVRSSHDGLVRLNVQIAVPTFYFGGDLPEVEWDEFPTGLTPALEPAVRAHALAVAQKLGFRKTEAPAATIVKMVEYFRDFDARPFPDELKGGDLLETIASSAIGVCRHRSLAFTFLAQSMGIPTRYVYNEAHAFVEVYWPGSGWRRLDLGGAANELNASANDGRRVHDPGDDGLPTPERYLEEQQRMAHNGWEPPEGGEGPRTNGGGGEGDQPTRTNPAAAGDVDSTHGAGETDASPLHEEPLFEEPPPDTRVGSLLRIVSATATVRRGESLDLEALLTAKSGGTLVGRDVEIYLGAVGSTSVRSARLLKTVKTGPGGRIRTSVQIPPGHAIGRWSLFLRFPGDTEYLPAVAE